MPILSTAAQNASLDNDYGATRGSNAPSAHQVALFNGDPNGDGVEISDTTETEAGTVPNGYERVTIPNNGTTWAPAADGRKETAAPVVFAVPTEAWEDVTHFVLFDDADGTTGWDSGALLETLVVTGAGTAPSADLAVFYGESVVPE